MAIFKFKELTDEGTTLDLKKVDVSATDHKEKASLTKVTKTMRDRERT